MKYKKLKLVLGVLFVFFLILGTNLIDKNNFKKIQNSIDTIYEDRLVAQGIVYEFSDRLHQKEIALFDSDSNFFHKKNAVLNTEIDQLIVAYEATSLTEEEAIVFEKLKTEFQQLKESERETMTSSNFNSEKIAPIILDVKKDLHDLADIQLEEGKRVMDASNKVNKTIELFTQMEIYLLVALAIVFQLLILGPIKKRRRTTN